MANKEAICARSRQWRLDNPERAKSYDLKKKYGITLEDKQKMLIEQDGKCAGCGTTEPGGRYNEWHVDHDHATDIVRGLLCATCNLTLGNAQEDVERLAGLIHYLNKHKVQEVAVA